MPIEHPRLFSSPQTEFPPASYYSLDTSRPNLIRNVYLPDVQPTTPTETAKNVPYLFYGEGKALVRRVDETRNRITLQFPESPLFHGTLELFRSFGESVTFVTGRTRGNDHLFTAHYSPDGMITGLIIPDPTFGVFLSDAGGPSFIIDEAAKVVHVSVPQKNDTDNQYVEIGGFTDGTEPAIEEWKDHGYPHVRVSKPQWEVRVDDSIQESLFCIVRSSNEQYSFSIPTYLPGIDSDRIAHDSGEHLCAILKLDEFHLMEKTLPFDFE